MVQSSRFPGSARSLHIEAYITNAEISELQARFGSQNIPARFGKKWQVVILGLRKYSGDGQLPRVFFLTLRDLEDFVKKNLQNDY